MTNYQQFLYQGILCKEEILSYGKIFRIRFCLFSFGSPLSIPLDMARVMHPFLSTLGTPRQRGLRSHFVFWLINPPVILRVTGPFLCRLDGWASGWGGMVVLSQRAREREGERERGRERRRESNVWFSLTECPHQGTSVSPIWCV